MAPQNSARLKMWNPIQKHTRRVLRRDGTPFYERGYIAKEDLRSSRRELRAFGSTAKRLREAQRSCRILCGTSRHSRHVELVMPSSPPACDSASPSTSPSANATDDGAFGEDAIWEERCDRASFLPSRFANALDRRNSSWPPNRIVKVLCSGCYSTECDLNITVETADVIVLRDECGSDYYKSKVRPRSGDRRSMRERWQRERFVDPLLVHELKGDKGGRRHNRD